MAGNRQVAAARGQPDLVPENMAYDPKSRQFYFGSMRKGKVLRCFGGGQCRTFAEDNESALVHYDFSGGVVHRYALVGADNFNDLALARAGDIYLNGHTRRSRLAAGPRRLSSDANSRAIRSREWNRDLPG